MLDPAIIVLISACLLVGAIVGVVGLLSWVGFLINRAASASAIYAPAVPKSPIGFSAELDVARAELEASDALESERERNFRLEGGFGRPQGTPAAATADASSTGRAPGCGACKRARKALKAVFRNF